MRIFCFCFLVFSFAFSWQQPENIIYWSKDRKLTWDDFIGKKNECDGCGAISSVSFFKKIRYKSVTSGMIDSITIEAVATFNKNKSFVLSGWQSEKALEHEQGHFDITEIYARKFRKALKEYISKYYDYRLRIDIDEIKNKIDTEWDNEGKLYDEETNFYQFEDEQKRWSEKIAKELKELEQYSDTSAIYIVRKSQK